MTEISTEQQYLEMVNQLQVKFNDNEFKMKGLRRKLYKCQKLIIACAGSMQLLDCVASSGTMYIEQELQLLIEGVYDMITKESDIIMNLFNPDDE